MGRHLFAGLMAATGVLAVAAGQAAEPVRAQKPAVEKAVAENRPAAAVDYLTQIKPIFARRCVACHGHLKQESGLRVDAARFLLKGGERGPAVVGGDVEKSVLLAAVSGKADFQMPPEGERLMEAEVALIRHWIKAGAKGPVDEKVLEDPHKHWSFIKPVRPVVPVPQDAAWVRNPIDAYVAAGHDAHGLKHHAPTPRNILLRRVSLDLTGLPPTPEELRAFLADDSPEAYAKAVDRLLESPQYGERWARHWMDVWRYSDWYGYQQELRNSVRHIWRWRDWIVESLNENKPYDRMVLEMLAADEISPEDPRALRATGYLARSYYKFNRNVWLDTVIEHTSKAFLGVTMNCARCHDHKYDPLTQQEYYQFRAIFEPYNVRTDAVPGQANLELDGVARVFDAKLDEKTFLFVRGDDKSPDKDHALEAALPALFTKAPLHAQPISLPFSVRYPGLKSDVLAQRIAAAKAEVAREQAAVDAARKALPAGGAETQTSPAAPELAIAEKRLAAAEAEFVALNARIAAEQAKFATPPLAELQKLSETAARAQRQAELRRAEANVSAAEKDAMQKQRAAKPAEDKSKKALAAAESKLKVEREKLDKARAAVEKPGAEYSPLSDVYPATSTGRRSALARFIVDRNNPLAARVAVNHIWLRHFDRAIVPTVFDFGLNGRAPSHPELLDWLAVEFMESGWNMKHLHRLMVLSSTYQMESAAPENSPDAAIDPDNIYLWRMNARRAEAEVVRDCVLSVSGQLDLTQGGPDLDAQQGLSTFRRSIYYRHAPEKFMTFLKLFDSASTTECYQRRPTIVPQQALALVNSPLSLEQSRRLAGRISAQLPQNGNAETNGRFIDMLFERLLCRPPTGEERAACREFLAAQEKQLSDAVKLTKFTTGAEAAVKAAADPRQRAREDLAHVMLNHHEFVTIR